MYNLDLAKKRKRRRRVAITSGICSVGICTMCIVAFLGRKVGSFTISLKNDGVSLTMDKYSNFENSTTYLHENGLDRITGPSSYVDLAPHFNDIDSEKSLDDVQGMDANMAGMRFYKYTFFLKNDGTVPANYEMKVNLTENHSPSNSNEAYDLDEYLRLVVFEDGHDSVYARRSLTIFDDDRKEYVCGTKEHVPADYQFKANLFESETVLSKLNNHLDVEEVRRYTLLFWLEGEDPECSVTPKDASLKIGVTINATAGQ